MRVYSVAPAEASDRVRLGVRNLIEHVDHEFVPPLSTRSGTLSMDTLEGESDVSRYLLALDHESWLVATDQGSVVGFLSYIECHHPTGLPPCTASLYATTVGVHRQARRKGVATALYGTLEHIAADRAVKYLTIRTWTSNAGHLRLLRGRGFEVIRRAPDHRAAGVGTVYLAYALQLPL